MNAPETTAATPSLTSHPVPNPSAYNGHDTLSQTEAAKVATWIKEDLAAGKVSLAQADAMFAELNTPIEHRGPDTRSAEQEQLDNHFPAAKDSDYTINYFTPGQALPVMPKEVKEFDASARTWLSGAGMPRELGNSLVNAISNVITATHKMSESQIAEYGEREYAKLSKAYGQDLEAKLRSAARMIHELDAEQPGLKQFLKSRGIGDNAMVVSMLIQQAERWELRNRR